MVSAPAKVMSAPADATVVPVKTGFAGGKIHFESGLVTPALA
jgi:hypothetical protein